MWTSSTISTPSSGTTPSGSTTRSSARSASALSPGSEFVVGAAALDANDYIIYNDATGAVLYDSDGAGGAAAIQFAQVDAGLVLTNLDFFVV